VIHLIFLVLSYIIPVVSAQSILHDSRVQNKIMVGRSLSNIQLKNTENESREIPDFGKKVVIVFYTDPDCKDINDPLSKAVKNGGFKDKIAGIGISNCADSWIPDILVRKGALKKEKQFSGSVLLIDLDHILSREWGLGNCNNLSMVIVIGKDMKVRYFKYIKTGEESIKVIPEIIGIIEKEMN
jgi:predicted transcriptional regulator